MAAGEKDRVFSAAQNEKDPDLRREAVGLLGAMGAQDELWQLYQKESAVDVKKQIIQAMFVSGNVTRMVELARTEQNAELRRTAVRGLGQMGSKGTGDALVQIYASDKDESVRKMVINALAMQDNAAGLVALARKEQDIAMKKAIVERLSHMGGNKIATDYLLEILNK
jgi:HEAT repeat protein